MADAQIVRSATSGVPASYTLPGSTRIVLKAVTAEIADNGAASDWLPCVTILSDSGHVIARATEQAVRVTAGGSAEVSWFPGVKPTGAGSSGGGLAPDYIMLTGVAVAIPSVVGGASGQIPWNEATYVTNDGSLWTFTLDGSGHIVQVNTTQPGRYEAIVTFTFGAPAASTALDFSIAMLGRVGGNAISTAEITTTDPYDGTTAVFGEQSGASAVFEADYSLDTATTGSVRGEWLWIKRWAT